MSQSLLGDTSATICAAILALWLALLNLDLLRWQRRVVEVDAEIKETDTLEAETYALRNRNGALYWAVPQLALEKWKPDRFQRHADRAERGAAIAGPEAEKLDEVAGLWLVRVGEFAKGAASHRIPLLHFLSTNHLAIVREGLVAASLLYPVHARGSMSDHDVELFEWAVALTDLAADYNSFARQQRSDVFIDLKGQSPRFWGPIVESPNRRRIVRVRLRYLLNPKLRLQRSARNRARRLLERVSEKITR